MPPKYRILQWPASGLSGGQMTSTSQVQLEHESHSLLHAHSSLGTSPSNTGIIDDLFDASDRPEGGNLVFWWNDIEKDNR